MFDGQEDLNKVKFSHRFLKSTLFRKMEEELSARAEIKHEMDVVFRLEGFFMTPHKEGMVSNSFKNLLFSFNLLQLRCHSGAVHSMSELEACRFS